MTEKGQYDEAFDYALNKVAGKKKKKTKYVVGLEEAFLRLNDRDQKRIDQILLRKSDAGYDEVYSVYQSMERRQNKVIPLMPLTSKDGYVAKFDIKDYTSLKNKTAKLSADYHLNQSKKMIQFANNGDQIAARTAYRHLENIDRYYDNYNGHATLKRQAHELGIVHVSIDLLEGKSHFGINYIADQLFRYPYHELNDFWTQFTHYETGQDYDYHVSISLDDLRVGRNHEHIDKFEFSKEIEEVRTKEVTKTIYESDSKSDSTNVVPLAKKIHEVIEEKEMITITALVLAIERKKRSQLNGQIRIFSSRSNQIDYTQPIEINHYFDILHKDITGDKRAIPEDFNLQSSPLLPFPSDQIAVEELTANMMKGIRIELKDFEFRPLNQP